MGEAALSTHDATLDFDAIIVGAGISGLYQLHRLREMGLKVRVLEAGTAVGGTWYWNRYPGARVDSQSYIYQYWFSETLIKNWNWSERFPAQPETERYLNFAADTLDLRKDIQFNTRVTATHWDEAQNCWRVTTEKDGTLSARFLVSCSGLLSAPIEEAFPGCEKFKGLVVHTARYPREGVDFKGKRVAVVGTGATGIQVVQTIAGEVGELKVFQRTPQYATPMRNPKFNDADRAHWRSKVKELYPRVNSTFTGFDFDLDHGSWHDHTPEQRLEILERVWADGSLSFWVGTFPEVLTDPAVNAEITEFVRAKIRARVTDPKVADKLVPNSYGFGTARVPLETNYYEAFNRSNVELVDAKETPIERFTERGLKTTAREYDFDIIILAIGFDAGTGALSRMNVHGRNNRSLTEEWRKDIRSALGLLVHGFPNLFTIAGPLAPSTAFCNMTTCLQQQVDWVSDCIGYLRRQGKSTIEATKAKQDEWVAHHDEIANATLIVKTNSWYMGANVAGKPQRLLSYIGGVGNYKKICDEVKASGYQGFEMH